MKGAPDFKFTETGIGTFDLCPNEGYKPTEEEDRYRKRLGELQRKIVTPPDGIDARDEGWVEIRDLVLKALRRRAIEFSKNEDGDDRNHLPNRNIIHSYKIEGVYDDRIHRIRANPFNIATSLTDGFLSQIVVTVADARISEDKWQFQTEFNNTLFVVQAVVSKSTASLPLRWLVRPTVSVFRQKEQRLHVDVEKQNTTFANDSNSGQHASLERVAQRKLHEYLSELAEIGKIGLKSIDTTQVKYAAFRLKEFRTNFTAREAGIVKNTYVVQLGFWAFLAFVTSSIGYAATSFMPIDWMLPRFRNFFLLIDGAAVGIWLSFSIRRVVLDFGDLVNLERDLLHPGLRVLFIIGLTTVVGLLLWTRAITFGIGGFQTDFQMNGTHAALIGALCGIAESAMTTAIGRRANDFAAGIGARQSLQLEASAIGIKSTLGMRNPETEL